MWTSSGGKWHLRRQGEKVTHPFDGRLATDSDSETPPSYIELSTISRKEWEQMIRSGVRSRLVGEEEAVRQVRNRAIQNARKQGSLARTDQIVRQQTNTGILAGNQGETEILAENQGKKDPQKGMRAAESCRNGWPATTQERVPVPQRAEEVSNDLPKGYPIETMEGTDDTESREPAQQVDEIRNVIEEADKEVMPPSIGQDGDGQEAQYSFRHRKGNPIEMMEGQNDLPEDIPIDTVMEGTEDANQESRKPAQQADEIRDRIEEADEVIPPNIGQNDDSQEAPYSFRHRRRWPPGMVRN
ncbi:uncharacterized protein N7529_007584 [Penicillium soppii]|uniref:uncharacterized protein n=1 Tax=Penicillium soppii TaxID=69789 RepID=UPI0025498FBC|nr:uncharacterized protein N7529_007584 [Penicillium soppii]KAJ5860274.1 hypothetical protein N7529_007584 [Penicillium soppii]